MRTLAFSRHNVLLCVEDEASYEIPDTMKCRASYTVLRVRGRTSARIIRVEREDRGEWVTDRLPTAERLKLEAHIERQYEEDEREASQVAYEHPVGSDDRRRDWAAASR